VVEEEGKGIIMVLALRFVVGFKKFAFGASRAEHVCTSGRLACLV
jgi:hypothetical protein